MLHTKGMPESRVADIYPLHNLLSAFHQMSESSLKVAKFIVENPKPVASMSIGELAKATGSNKSAVVRVSKPSGYKGYRGLRVASSAISWLRSLPNAWFGQSLLNLGESFIFFSAPHHNMPKIADGA
jgi:Helix-turn-helix domain, rpiR family